MSAAIHVLYAPGRAAMQPSHDWPATEPGSAPVGQSNHVTPYAYPPRTRHTHLTTFSTPGRLLTYQGQRCPFRSRCRLNRRPGGCYPRESPEYASRASAPVATGRVLDAPGNPGMVTASGPTLSPGKAKAREGEPPYGVGDTSSLCHPNKRDFQS